MLKLRLKRIGRKRAPAYRLVLMENTTRRDGRPIVELGWYDPIGKHYSLSTTKIKNFLRQGAQPTQTVATLLKRARILQNK
jgi:small subunit ribosomal protein S16